MALSHYLSSKNGAYFYRCSILVGVNHCIYLLAPNMVAYSHWNICAVNDITGDNSNNLLGLLVMKTLEKILSWITAICLIYISAIMLLAILIFILVSISWAPYILIVSFVLVWILMEIVKFLEKR